GADGLFEVPGVAEGSWELLVGAPGLATMRFAVAVPGPPVDVALPLAGRLAVEIPELLGTSAVAHLEIVDASGRRFPSLSSDRYDPILRVESGRRFIEGLPPGQWTVRAATLDGAVWTGVAATVPGALSQVRLD
ncbi:MAG TPA: hypothetical protein VMS86_06255, partial [Thermoanaerobaculia bacterium]|nr:hypothetical protein [Thermoanaerobaculia bacterium]